MLRAMLRDLRAHTGRVVMMLVAVVLGVAFVVATWVMSDSAAHTLTGGDTRSDVGVVVQVADRDNALRVADRGGALTDIDRQSKLTPQDLDKLRQLPGVTGATGVVIGDAALVDHDGKLGLGSPRRAGTSWDGSQRFTLTSGRAPAGSGEIALANGLAGGAHLRVGDTARVILGEGTTVSSTVVGLFDYHAIGAESAPSLVYDQPTALRLLGHDSFDRIELSTPSGSADSVAAAAHDLTLSGQHRVYTGAQLLDEAERLTADSASSTREALLAFAGVALLAGMFVIANTFTMLVAQRTRQFALLRAVGASRGQIRRAVILESGVLGLLGSTIGAGLGIGLGLLAVTVLQPAATTVDLTVSPLGIIVGYVAGVAVTVISAYGAARRGATVPPIAALRMDAVLPPRALLSRSIAGAVLVVGGLAVVFATSTTALNDTKRLICMAGAIAAWIGVLLLTPVLAGAVLRPLSRLFSRLGGPATKLALRNAIRDPRRTAATASALTVGLALVCAFASVGQTFITRANDSVSGLIPAGTTVVRPAGGTTLDSGVADRIAALPGVSAVLAAPKAPVDMRHDGTSLGTTTMSAVDPGALAATLRPRITSGTGDLSQGVIMLEADADEHGLHAGDTLTLGFDRQTARQVRIAGTYDALEGQVSLYIDASLVPRQFRGDLDTVYATGAEPVAVHSAIDTAFKDRPDVLVTDQQGLIDDAVAEFQFALYVIYALFGAALLVAIFGVINTLALSVTERTREIGVLRAVGASRSLVRSAIRRESVVITSFGGVLGVIIGLGLGATMQHIMLNQPLWQIGVPWTAIVIALIGMIVVGVLAAAWPARRAARINMLAAIATQ